MRVTKISKHVIDDVKIWLFYNWLLMCGFRQRTNPCVYHGVSFLRITEFHETMYFRSGMVKHVRVWRIRSADKFKIINLINILIWLLSWEFEREVCTSSCKCLRIIYTSTEWIFSIVENLKKKKKGNLQIY